MKVAIVGSGIAGLSCAWLLRKKHDITLFEKNAYLGGHSNTSVIKYGDANIAVDTGFIVFNFRTYPNLKAFFELLNVKINKSIMSFGIKDLDSGFEYGGHNLLGFFSQKRNLFNFKFLKMLKDVVKFNKSAIRLIERGDSIKQKTLSEFIDDLRLGQYFKNYYLYSMAAAIWSCPFKLIKDFPAKNFLHFFYNHGLLTATNQPDWYTVAGGSKEYVKKITSSFSDRIRLNSRILSSKKVGDKIILTDDSKQTHAFDHVVFASHTDQTYQMISDKTEDEIRVLSNVKYSKNVAILHKDTNQMPNSKKAWASWVYLSSKQRNKVSVSYWMNSLQNINEAYPLFVTLNPINKIEKKNIFGEYEYDHPIFDSDAAIAQEKLDKIQGKRNIWFCGAWTKYGFHEDGLNSAIDIAQRLGIKVDWKK